MYDNGMYGIGAEEVLKQFSHRVENEFESTNNRIMQVDRAFNNRINVIEQRLFIVSRNIELEKEFEELKEAYLKYKEIESRLITFKTLQNP